FEVPLPASTPWELIVRFHIKNVTGRKSEALDCQWIQRLHTYGLLGGSFRPADSAYELYHVYEAKIAACDEQLVELARLPARVDGQAQPLPAKAKGKRIDEALRLGLYLKLGVDLTAVESIGSLVALTALSELGPDLSRFKTEKHFTSCVGLCPNNRI